VKLSLRTPRPGTKALAIAIGALALTGCGDPTDQLTGGRGNVPGAETPGVLPEALQCTQKPEGRSYTLFDGSKLEATRANENVGVNRARLKPYAVMAGEYKRVLGLVPPGLASAGGSFDEPPARWYAEASHSGVSLHAFFDISFEGCVAFTASAEYAVAPTTESASQVCSTLMRKAWSRSPSPEETTACANLAATKLDEEPDPHRRWAYVCASVLSSTQFLTF